MNTPLIKWTGSKRPIASKIISYFPLNIETYYETFLGGGSVFFKLLSASNINIKHFELSDINCSLINIFKLVKSSPKELILSYEYHWENLKKDSNYFYEQRDIYNKTEDPSIFYFLTRTCYNGTIRYNKNGEFNTSHHFGRTGMHPSKIEKIILYYSFLMKGKSINFNNCSFEKIEPQNPRDIVYLDPPYTNTKSLYFGNICFPSLLEWINSLKCSWFMNINGVNKTDNEESVNIPFTGRTLFSSGNSSFSRMKKRNVDVSEYFYYKVV
jgi:DNA adenine methylase